MGTVFKISEIPYRNGTKQLLLDVAATLDEVLTHPDCPAFLVNSLSGKTTWQKRSEFSVAKMLAAPGMAPQFVGALLAWGAIGILEDGSEQPLEQLLAPAASHSRIQALALAADPPGRIWAEARTGSTPADTPIVWAMAVLDMADGLVHNARIALSGVATQNVALANSANLLINRPLDDGSINQVAAAVAEETSCARRLPRQRRVSQVDGRRDDPPRVAGLPGRSGVRMNVQDLQVEFTLNGQAVSLPITRGQNLLELLRAQGLYSVKDGCSQGDCGVCTVLVDGKPMRSCMLRALDMQGRTVLTVEGLSPDGAPGPIQRAYMDSGAIQCGYCTPGQLMVTHALLQSNPDPSDLEIREALGGDTCRCTGFVRTLDAVKRAAAMLRGEEVPPVTHIELELPKDTTNIKLPKPYYRKDGNRWPLPPLVFTPPEMSKTKFIGKTEQKVDAEKLAQGRGVFTNDIDLPGMLYGGAADQPARACPHHPHRRQQGARPARRACRADPP